MKEAIYTIDYILENQIDKQAFGFIYITTNLVNGKKYIGQKQFNKNWETYLGSGLVLKQALRRHGKEKFHRDIIAIGENKTKLNTLEISYIDMFSATKNDKFYNVAIGGQGGNIISNFSNEEKQNIYKKISKAMVGKPSWTKGKKLNKETKAKISKNHADFSGGNHPQSKRIICIDTSEIFNSISEAYIIHNINISSIVQCCKGKYSHAGNFLWMYYEDYKNEQLRTDRIHIFKNREKIKKQNIGKSKYGENSPTARKIICLANLEVFNSIQRASEKYKILPPNITTCCQGKSKSAGKTIDKIPLTWMYYDDYLILSEKERINIIKQKNKEAASSTKIICVNTNEIFESATQAGKKYNIDNSQIGKCCKNKVISAGKHPITGEPLKWMHYEDYIKQQNKSA